MTRLQWDKSSDQVYEFGVSKGVLYPQESDGVAWLGLTNVKSDTNSDPGTSYYIDGRKYEYVPGFKEYIGEVRAYTYPEVFNSYMGFIPIVQALYAGDAYSPYKTFGLCYRTEIADSASGGRPKGYKLHIVYNAIATPLPQERSTIQETTEPEQFIWSITTKPLTLFNVGPVSYFVVDSTKTTPATMAILEDALYGTNITEPRLPGINEIISILSNPVGSYGEWQTRMLNEGVDTYAKVDNNYDEYGDIS